MGRPFRKVKLLCLLALCSAGCGSDELNSPAAAQLKGIGVLYLDYAFSRNGKGPTTEQDFKKHLRGMPDHVLESRGMKAKALDEAFVSLRDQEPFVVLYGTNVSSISAKEAPVVAHEKTGKNGTRLVGFANGKVELADEARLKELISAK